MTDIQPEAKTVVKRPEITDQVEEKAQVPGPKTPETPAPPVDKGTEVKNTSSFGPPQGANVDTVPGPRKDAGTKTDPKAPTDKPVVVPPKTQAQAPVYIATHRTRYTWDMFKGAHSFTISLIESDPNKVMQRCLDVLRANVDAKDLPKYTTRLKSIEVLD